MRNVFLIAYDIICPKRYRKIYKSMCGAGQPMQYSVFRCELSLAELQMLQSDLWPLLKLDEDRIMIVDLGPVAGRGAESIEFWGQPLVVAHEHTATIV
ncbi:CRISPR-associated endonuclease Cas2 [Lacunimicrobium album]